jgi:AcrR family transcriptional regulator
MSEAGKTSMRDPVEAFTALVAERGYAGVSLRDVALESGLAFAELYRRYRDKPALMAALIERIDDEVLAGTPGQSDPEETARDRLFDVMMRRYDALKPHRAYLRQLRQLVLRDPILALSLAPAMRRSAAAMLEAAAIPSDGLAGAVQQSGLVALHAAVFRVFQEDETTDLSKTMAALDSRLKSAENLIQTIEKYRFIALSRGRETAVS